MPHLITGIMALNMSGNAINSPQPGGLQSRVENEAGSLCQLSETIKLEGRVLVIHKKLSA